MFLPDQYQTRNMSKLFSMTSSGILLGNLFVVRPMNSMTLLLASLLLQNSKIGIRRYTGEKQKSRIYFLDYQSLYINSFHRDWFADML